MKQPSHSLLLILVACLACLATTVVGTTDVNRRDLEANGEDRDAVSTSSRRTTNKLKLLREALRGDGHSDRVTEDTSSASAAATSSAQILKDILHQRKQEQPDRGAARRTTRDYSAELPAFCEPCAHMLEMQVADAPRGPTGECVLAILAGCEAGDLTWEAKRYEDPMAPLVATDLEKLEGGGGEGAAGVCAEGCAGAGSRQALVLSFSLPTAAYATM